MYPPCVDGILLCNAADDTLDYPDAAGGGNVLNGADAAEASGESSGADAAGGAGECAIAGGSCDNCCGAVIYWGSRCGGHGCKYL